MTKAPARSVTPVNDPEIVSPGSDDDRLREESRKARASDPRPNVLLLFTDQQTISALSCAGNRWVNTPHMDALAKSGVRFLNSYCAAPISGPSRGSMITGQPPHTSGVIYNSDPLRVGIPTIGSILRESGYYTAWTGKWHLPESYLREAIDSHGFHHRPLTKDLPWVALGDQTDFLTAMDAEFFLRWQAAKQPKPWFLGVSLHNPHDICYHVREKGLEHQNKDKFPPLPANFDVDPKEPEALQLRRGNSSYGQEVGGTKDWDEERWREYLHTYAHLVTQVDRAVGQVLKALQEGGWSDNTLVIFTSDHGEGVAAHWWVTKLSLYEESAAVPLVMSFPGKIPAGRVLAEPLASGLDLLPTICDYADTKSPTLPGRSLRAAIEGQADPDNHYVVCELAADKKRPEIQGRMVRTQRFKYCAYSPGKNAEQLFDMKNDPGETKNLAADPARAETLRHHRSLLADWCKKTGDPFRGSGS